MVCDTIGSRPRREGRQRSCARLIRTTHGDGMKTPREQAERQAASDRTLALLQAAARRFPAQPRLAAAWLHDPHPLLLGASPAAAAWYSARTAEYATLLLEADTSEQVAYESGFGGAKRGEQG